MSKNKYWSIGGEELEEHLAADCELTIIEPYKPLPYHTQEERAMLAQFPEDDPTQPFYLQDDYDEVLTQPLSNETAELDLYYQASMQFCEPVGEPFQTARFWCLRVKYE